MRLFLTLIVTFFLGCSESKKENTSNNSTPPQKATLKVAYVENPNFRSHTDNELLQLLESTKKTSREHFGISLTFEKIEHLNIKDVFDLLDSTVIEHYITPNMLNIHKEDFTHQEIMDVQDNLRLALRSNKNSFDAKVKYAQKYIISDQNVSCNGSLSKALSDTMFAKVKSYKKYLSKDQYNEWLYWSALGSTQLNYDIIITNTPIISVEKTFLDMHTALRGGITVGTTEYNPHTQFKTFVFWSTFAFFENDSVIKQLRNSETYTTSEALELSGIYLTHEIGHMVFHFGHPFSQTSCVMNPVPLLKFREWSHALNPQQCQIGSSPEMQINAVNIETNFYED